MPRKLGGFTYPYDPPRGNWSGIPRTRSAKTYQTLTGNVTVSWGFHIGDELITERWPMMSETFYKTLEDMFLAEHGTATYVYELETGVKYEVEIVSLQGTPYMKDSTSGERYYRDVTMELRIVGMVVD